MGNICCTKYEIIEKCYIYQIKKKQDIIKKEKKRIKEWQEKCVNCKVYGIIECKKLNYHKDWFFKINQRGSQNQNRGSQNKIGVLKH